ncbi:hypothetical protein H696_00514 [Fonticula alba]|uniref:Uncharacterized protein n=1 Tax=Fonticula alba TaxID=691883 RepID=A0A058ZF07_FONAL|nr:hypothetical protein H696_00514 [Fonticula alba]KCV72960.1 hypothetical protein H696_00514 [Fonticula alba]|eukprot:XP_009492661.1 hypothetical protein H696_00514 [Fonticula alba]
MAKSQEEMAQAAAQQQAINTEGGDDEEAFNMAGRGGVLRKKARKNRSSSQEGALSVDDAVKLLSRQDHKVRYLQFQRMLQLSAQLAVDRGWASPSFPPVVRELWLAYVTFLDCPRMAAAFQIAVPAVADPSIPEGLEGESDDDADVDSARSQALRLYHFQLNETLAAALLYCSAAHLRLPTWSLEDCRSLVSLSGHTLARFFESAGLYTPAPSTLPASLRELTGLRNQPPGARLATSAPEAIHRVANLTHVPEPIGYLATELAELLLPLAKEFPLAPPSHGTAEQASARDDAQLDVGAQHNAVWFPEVRAAAFLVVAMQLAYGLDCLVDYSTRPGTDTSKRLPGFLVMRNGRLYPSQEELEAVAGPGALLETARERLVPATDSAYRLPFSDSHLGLMSFHSWRSLLQAQGLAPGRAPRSHQDLDSLAMLQSRHRGTSANSRVESSDHPVNWLALGSVAVQARTLRSRSRQFLRATQPQVVQAELTAVRALERAGSRSQRFPVRATGRPPSTGQLRSPFFADRAGFDLERPLLDALAARPTRSTGPTAARLAVGTEDGGAFMPGAERVYFPTADAPAGESKDARRAQASARRRAGGMSALPRPSAAIPINKHTWDRNEDPEFPTRVPLTMLSFFHNLPTEHPSASFRVYLPPPDDISDLDALSHSSGEYGFVVSVLARAIGISERHLYAAARSVQRLCAQSAVSLERMSTMSDRTSLGPSIPIPGTCSALSSRPGGHPFQTLNAARLRERRILSSAPASQARELLAARVLLDSKYHAIRERYPSMASDADDVSSESGALSPSPASSPALLSLADIQTSSAGPFSTGGASSVQDRGLAQLHASHKRVDTLRMVHRQERILQLTARDLSRKLKSVESNPYEVMHR